MTTEVNGWPTLQIPPGPTDAELEAERDAKHAAAVEEWVRADQQRAYICGYFAAIDMVNDVQAGILADAEREALDSDPVRNRIGLGRKLAMLMAGERINGRAAMFGRQFSEYR